MSQAVVSISKMLSVICLEEMHLCEGCMHPMVYQWRPQQIAEVRSLQSQLHSVNGRSASGDLIILPLSSMSEVLVTKTSYFRQSVQERYLLPTDMCKR